MDTKEHEFENEGRAGSPFRAWSNYLIGRTLLSDHSCLLVSTRGYLEQVLEISKATQLTAHKARPHNDQDLRDFARIREGEHSGQAEARGERLEFTYNRTCFHDRYKRQHREQLCSTIVAHLAKDGLMFIHPTQNRSLTPREAARIQSFPDWFQFPVARTHQFRLIGNAVPPLVAEAVGEELLTFLESKNAGADVIPFELAPLPKDEAQAVECESHPMARTGAAHSSRQLASRKELVTNPAVAEAATRLYFDSASNSLKRGSGSKTKGAPRRLANLLNQLDLTWYLYGMTSDEILTLLPKEFDRFRSTA
jgi:hypothetical protein